jgi:rubrerythrin
MDKEELKELFTRLMNEEKIHKDKYAGMLTSKEKERTAGVSDDDEYGLYIKTLIEEHRRLSGSPQVSMYNIGEVLNYAVAREKDSVLFYVGLKQFVPEKDRQTVNEIIREEVRHIVKISELRNELI